MNFAMFYSNSNNPEINSSQNKLRISPSKYLQNNGVFTHAFRNFWSYYISILKYLYDPIARNMCNIKK